MIQSERCKEQHWSGRFKCNLPKGHRGRHIQTIWWTKEAKK